MHVNAARLLLAMALGAVVGAVLHAVGGAEPVLYWIANPVGQIWLSLLLVMMMPLASSALVLGLQELEPAALARAGGKILGLTVLLSATAVAIGYGVFSLIAPGEGVDRALLPAAGAAAPAATDPMDLFLAQFPRNAIAAAAGDNLLPVLVFAVLFGLALRRTRTPGALALRAAIEGLYDVSVSAMGSVMRLAPWGVGALTLKMAAKGGIAALLPLGWFVLTVPLGLALMLLVVYPLVLRVLGSWSPLAFYRGARPAMLVAFSTASSAATLPTSLAVAEQRLRLSPETARFVLTIGATGNQNGTALFEGVAVLFLAQVYGVALAPAAQVGVLGVALLGGVGTAGVPGGALAVITAVGVSVGLPPEAVGLLVGVDRLLDMCRTTLNVTGDLVIAAVVAPPVAAGERAADG